MRAEEVPPVLGYIGKVTQQIIYLLHVAFNTVVTLIYRFRLWTRPGARGEETQSPNREAAGSAPGQGPTQHDEDSDEVGWFTCVSSCAVLCALRTEMRQRDSGREDALLRVKSALLPMPGACRVP